MSTPKVISFTAKCSDLFGAALINEEHETIFEYDGYVPKWFPGDHYGDYVEFDVELETGRILNWKPPSAATLKKWMKGNE